MSSAVMYNVKFTAGTVERSLKRYTSQGVTAQIRKAVAKNGTVTITFMEETS